VSINFGMDRRFVFGNINIDCSRSGIVRIRKVAPFLLYCFIKQDARVLFILPRDLFACLGSSDLLSLSVLSEIEAFRMRDETELPSQVRMQNLSRGFVD